MSCEEVVDGRIAGKKCEVGDTSEIVGDAVSARFLEDVGDSSKCEQMWNRASRQAGVYYCNDK